jgi:Leucine-rich repeat (LRR) protein
MSRGFRQALRLLTAIVLFAAPLQAATPDLPSPEALLQRHIEAIGGAAALRQAQSLSFKGEVSLPFLKAKAPIEFLFQAPDRFYCLFRYHHAFFGFVKVPFFAKRQAECGYDGTNGWLDPDSAEWYGVEVANLQFDANDNLVLNSGDVSALSLDGNVLAGSIPGSLGNFTALETLDLSGNQLSGSIPDVFTLLTHLQILDLSSNQLSGTIPTSLNNLTSLGKLDLSVNQLSGSIPDVLTLLTHLQILDLSSNQLSGSLPASLSHLTALETLDLSGNELQGTIPPFFTFLNQLQTLDLSTNQLSGIIPAGLGNVGCT